MVGLEMLVGGVEETVAMAAVSVYVSLANSTLRAHTHTRKHTWDPSCS